MSERVPLPGFDDQAPRDRFCDLILTGGVTSAIAYPAAIFALAMAYRFNSIGGSSSGAGTAALAAAAEYRRRHGSSDGFRILLERAAAVAETVDGKTRLEWLFQPEKGNDRLFNALVPGFARPDGKLAGLASGLIGAYAGSWQVIASVVVLTIGWLAAFLAVTEWWIVGSTGSWTWGGAKAAVLSGTLAVVLILALALVVLVLIARDVGRVVRCDYGLCTGSASEETVHPPLTDWLHALIQEIAGRPVDRSPLTFADLAAAPGSPQETLGDPCPAGSASINLQMYTANVTHGRPYVFPQAEMQEAEDDPPLYFCESEMLRLFPKAVVDHMKVDPVTGEDNLYSGAAQPGPAPAAGGAGGTLSRIAMGTSPVAGNEAEPMYRLPRKHLPIVVAARMSVSFPVLFTAVPLWVLDNRNEPAVFRRCLFSDGSLCSTFPIHLFDSAVPSWPTFGISLHELPASEVPAREATASGSGPGAIRRLLSFVRGLFAEGGRPAGGKTAKRAAGKVTLPTHSLRDNENHWSEYHWNEFETEPDTFERLSGFANALLSTMKDWNDATLARLPGVRERVVRVGLYPHIGGLNIQMTGDEIRSLAELGREAAVKLLRRYALLAPAPSGKVCDGWNEHRWVRLNVLLDCFSRALAGATWAASQGRYGKPLRDLIRQAVEEPPLTAEKGTQLLAAQAAALDRALNALMQAERELTAPTVEQPHKPTPRPVLRVRPPL